MNKIILATHGNFAMGLRDTLEMLAGDVSELVVVNIDEQGQSVFEHKIEEIVVNSTEKSILVLTDIMGGSPFQTFLKHKLNGNDNIEIVTGVNLPMILDVYLSKDVVSLDELVEKAVEIGKSGVSAVKIGNKENNLDE